MKIKTLQINNGCSAYCMHCPYSHKIGNQFKIESFIKDIDSSDYLIITGGEPMEHKKIKKIIKIINAKQRYFRIATGGHVVLEKYLDYIKKFEFFCGFSIGTDIIISERNPMRYLEKIWITNIKLLLEKHINYSISITFDLDFELYKLIFFLKEHTQPTFVTLSEIQGKPLSLERFNFVSKLIESTLQTEVIYGYRN